MYKKITILQLVVNCCALSELTLRTQCLWFWRSGMWHPCFRCGLADCTISGRIDHSLLGLFGWQILQGILEWASHIHKHRLSSHYSHLHHLHHLQRSRVLKWKGEKNEANSDIIFVHAYVHPCVCTSFALHMQIFINSQILSTIK